MFWIHLFFQMLTLPRYPFYCPLKTLLLISWLSMIKKRRQFQNESILYLSIASWLLPPLPSSSQRGHCPCHSLSLQCAGSPPSYVLNLVIIYSHICAYDLPYHSHQCKMCWYFNSVASTYMGCTSVPLKQNLWDPTTYILHLIPFSPVF